MCILNQEEHIGHVKQLKSDRYQDRNFFFSSIAYVHPYFPKKWKPNVKRGIWIFLCNFLIMHIFVCVKATKRKDENPCNYKINECFFFFH